MARRELLLAACLQLACCMLAACLLHACCMLAACDIFAIRLVVSQIPKFMEMQYLRFYLSIHYRNVLEYLARIRMAVLQQMK